MRRIIFLDIDGILASEEFLRRRDRREIFSEGNGVIDPEKIKLLDSLKDLNPEIVISSSWGTTADEPLKAGGLSIPIIGHTQHLYEDHFCRGNEIEKWIIDNIGNYGTKWSSNHKFLDFKYVIIDDDDDMLYGQRNNFIQIDPIPALTEYDITKIREILS